MANHKSAEKRVRQTAKRNERNKIQRSIFRTVQKRLRTAIEAGNKEEAQGILPRFQQAAAKLVTKGVLKKNNAARKTSRLTTQVNNLK